MTVKFELTTDEYLGRKETGRVLSFKRFCEENEGCVMRITLYEKGDTEDMTDGQS